MLKGWTQQGFRPFRLEVLTPVFIGSGDSLSSLDFVLGTAADDCRLYHIDMEAWLADHAEDASVMGIIASADLRRIRRMFQEKTDTQRYGLYSTGMSDALRQELLSHIADAQSNSTNEIAAMMRDPLTGVPYLPGSSLKGAISTPIINHMDLKRRLADGKPGLKESVNLRGGAADQRREYAGWMKDVFGDIREHAMQALKVSDLPAAHEDAHIYRAVEVGKPKTDPRTGRSLPRTPKPPAEALRPGTELWGRLFLAEQGGAAHIVLPDGTRFSHRDLCSICNEFYRARFQTEMRTFYAKYPHLRKTAEALRSAAERISALGPDDMLLRVGHYSHVECVTVSKNSRYNTPMPCGTTRTLADGLWPFGWVILHACTNEEFFTHAVQGERQAHAAWEARALATLQEEKAQREKLEAARQEAEARRAEAEARKRAEAEEQERLAQMSEEDRLAELLKSGRADEKCSMDVFSQLDQWEGEVKMQLAEALCAYWKATGKWSGKQSKKQAAKVDALKLLLGHG